MGAPELLASWPVLRQLREGDPLRLGRLGEVWTSAALAAAWIGGRT